MTLTFADVSSHNTITSWPTFLGSVDACVVKATQGSTYVWPGAAPALAAIRAANKPTGAYAFAGDLGSDGKVRCGDPVAEADFFLANYAWRPGEVPVLDFEPSVMPGDPDGWCAAFVSRVDSRIGVVPWTYMNSSLARSYTWLKTRATGSQLWVAQYGVNNGQPGAAPNPPPWGSFVAWQYTSMGARPGVASPPLDLSTFYGDLAAWKAYGTPGGDMTPQDLLNTPMLAADGKTYPFGAFIAQTNVNAYNAARDAAIARKLAEQAASGVVLSKAQIDAVAAGVAADLAAGYKVAVVPTTPPAA